MRVPIAKVVTFQDGPDQGARQRERETGREEVRERGGEGEKRRTKEEEKGQTGGGREGGLSLHVSVRILSCDAFL